MHMIRVLVRRFITRLDIYDEHASALTHITAILRERMNSAVNGGLNAQLILYGLGLKHYDQVEFNLASATTVR